MNNFGLELCEYTKVVYLWIIISSINSEHDICSCVHIIQLHTTFAYTCLYCLGDNLCLSLRIKGRLTVYPYIQKSLISI